MLDVVVPKDLYNSGSASTQDLQLGHDPTNSRLYSRTSPWCLFGKAKLIERHTVLRHI
jgi:hypothetical protein